MAEPPFPCIIRSLPFAIFSTAKTAILKPLRAVFIPALVGHGIGHLSVRLKLDFALRRRLLI